MRALPVAEVIEDAEFLDSTGTGATDAAKRLGFPTAHAMEKWLERQGRFDLWLSLKRRDPAGTHLSGSDRKRARLMSENNTHPDSIATVLDTAGKSTRARTRKKAEKVRELVDDLRGIIAAEKDKDERKEAARKDVQRLERELAEAKARLRGGTATVDIGPNVSAAEIRAWAAKNGVECPAMGRVPAEVREAFEAAEDAA